MFIPDQYELGACYSMPSWHVDQINYSTTLETWAQTEQSGLGPYPPYKTVMGSALLASIIPPCEYQHVSCHR